MRLAIVICFRDEAEHLPRLLASLCTQTEPADEILLVDDGSVDGSTALAADHADRHANVRFLRRERSPEEAAAGAKARDRLSSAPELLGFHWGVAHLSPPWDVVAKMDGDLELTPALFADVRRALADDPHLGIVGSYLSVVGTDGRPVREHTPPHHVRGATKFYRAACFAEISPLPAHLGWDTIDELRARRRGWSTRSIAVSSGDSIHLRPTGSHDGMLRAYRRWGSCAWGYGAHPLMVLAGAARRAGSRPYAIGGINYALGWAGAGLSRAPRVESETRVFARREGLARLRGALAGRTPMV